MASPVLAGLTILMLGDSHFATQGYLVSTLGDQLMQQGAKVVTEAACGAQASIWVTGDVAPCGIAERVENGPVRKGPPNSARPPQLDQLVQQYHPNLIIVGFGDTMAGYAQPAFPIDWVAQQVTALTRRIQAYNISCIWVGPGWGNEGGPYFKNFARVRMMSDYLSHNVAPCRYIDSLRFAQPGEWATFDGQHYTLPYYLKWGRAIDAEIVQMVGQR